MQSNVWFPSLGAGHKVLYQSILCGTFHQGDLRFWPNSGKQCVANVLSFFCKSNEKPVDKLSERGLDNILVTGNRLYGIIHAIVGEEYLHMDNLPRTVVLDNEMFALDINDSRNGVLSNVGNTRLTFTWAFSASGTVFMVCQGKCIGEKYFNGCYYLLDSHSNSSTGRPSADGKSCLLQFWSFDSLISHLQMFFNVKRNCFFEVSPCTVSTLGFKAGVKCEVNAESIPTEALRLNESNVSLVPTTKDDRSRGLRKGDRCKVAVQVNSEREVGKGRVLKRKIDVASNRSMQSCEMTKVDVNTVNSEWQFPTKRTLKRKIPVPTRKSLVVENGFAVLADTCTTLEGSIKSCETVNCKSRQVKSGNPIDSSRKDSCGDTSEVHVDSPSECHVSDKGTPSLVSGTGGSNMELRPLKAMPLLTYMPNTMVSKCPIDENSANRGVCKKVRKTDKLADKLSPYAGKNNKKNTRRCKQVNAIDGSVADGEGVENDVNVKG